MPDQTVSKDAIAEIEAAIGTKLPENCRIVVSFQPADDDEVSGFALSPTVTLGTLQTSTGQLSLNPSIAAQGGQSLTLLGRLATW